MTAPERLPVTAGILLSQPGRLTAEHLSVAPPRRRSPVVIFAVSCAAYFALQWVVGRAIERRPVASPSAETQVVESLPVSPDVSALLSRALANPEQVSHGAEVGIAEAMVVLVPAFAGLTRLAYAKRAPDYRAHLTFALHLFAATFLAQTVSDLVGLLDVTALTLVVQLGVLIYLSWYVVEALRRTFGGTSRDATLKATLVGLGYVVCLLVVLACIAAFTLLTA